MKGLITKIPFLIHIYTNTFQTFFFQKSRHLRSSAISSASRRRTTSAAAPPASAPSPSLSLRLSSPALVAAGGPFCFGNSQRNPKRNGLGMKSKKRNPKRNGCRRLRPPPPPSSSPMPAASSPSFFFFFFFFFDADRPRMLPNGCLCNGEEWSRFGLSLDFHITLSLAVWSPHAFKGLPCNRERPLGCWPHMLPNACLGKGEDWIRFGLSLHFHIDLSLIVWSPHAFNAFPFKNKKKKLFWWWDSLSLNFKSCHLIVSHFKSYHLIVSPKATRERENKWEGVRYN